MHKATSISDAHARWHREVPGARWLKADLHTHVTACHASGGGGVPGGAGIHAQPSTTVSYSRQFLQGAVSSGVHVLGITSLPSGTEDVHDAINTVWHIVDEWNTGTDSLGTPFRDTIYAIFPGFELLSHDGKSGLRLLFLFDPEIGRSKLMKALDLAMGGMSPRSDGNPGMSDLTATEVFDCLDAFCESESTGSPASSPPWNYLTLAPQAESESGVFGALEGQVLERFPHAGVVGIGLGRDRLPNDAIDGRNWLPGLMAEHNQSFFHASDACTVDDIGCRYTWIKIASPRITALRQAFIAGHSRIRVGYERGHSGALSETPNPPDVLVDRRPWLRSVTVSGGASFFGSDDNHEGHARFDFSPDLTCIIGGSMTGKSTLLDGLRVHTGAQLPWDRGITEQVEARGRGRFLAGSPEVVLDCRNVDTTAPLREQLPAVFYTQSELQRLTEEEELIEILSGLAASKKGDIAKLGEDLDRLDRTLIMGANRFGEIRDRLADAEQAYERSRSAAEKIAAFSQAGIGDLARVSAEAHRWQELAEATGRLLSEIAGLARSVAEVDVSDTSGHAAEALRGASRSGTDLDAVWSRLQDLLHSAEEEAVVANATIRIAASALEAYKTDARVQVDRRLAELGHDGSRIHHLQTLNAQASLSESYRANLEHVRSEMKKADASFMRRLAERRSLVARQRMVFDQVIETVFQRFDGRIKVRRINDGDTTSLDGFIRSIGQRGITRWWNDLAGERRPTPEALLEKAAASRLDDIGMSGAVGASFLAHLTPSRQLEIAALRCTDVYLLECRMDDGTYRRLVDLSGGQRVSLLLSLLLETDDERPLIIDQPEDELDNRFLFETLLPALKRLKGRRQVILATHNANIVVNGDADQVIHLEATANRGWVAHSGAIDEPAVRDAIIRTVDGGEEAFLMRNLKYGF